MVFGAPRGDDQQRAGAAIGDDVEQQFLGRRIDPLQILDQDDHRRQGGAFKKSAAQDFARAGADDFPVEAAQAVAARRQPQQILQKRRVGFGVHAEQRQAAPQFIFRHRRALFFADAKRCSDDFREWQKGGLAAFGAASAVQQEKFFAVQPLAELMQQV